MATRYRAALDHLFCCRSERREASSPRREPGIPSRFRDLAGHFRGSSKRASAQPDGARGQRRPAGRSTAHEVRGLPFPSGRCEQCALEQVGMLWVWIGVGWVYFLSASASRTGFESPRCWNDMILMVQMHLRQSAAQFGRGRAAG